MMITMVKMKDEQPYIFQSEWFNDLTYDTQKTHSCDLNF
uniref:Uncharacterized protein n=1 Tax=Tetranychus urticae TaxID=32264 RepID=T1KMQ6_TETUR